MTEVTEVGEVPVRRRRVALAMPAWVRYWPVVVLVVLQVLLLADAVTPAGRTVLALVTLLGVPTLALAQRAAFPTDSAPARWLYAFGLSLLALVLVSLLLNTVLPLLGVDHPLASRPVLLTWLVLDVALLVWRAEVPLVRWVHPALVVRRLLDARFETAQTLAVLALVLSVIGAVRLNNGAGGAVAVIGQLLAGAAVLALLLRREGSLGRDVRVVALVAAALLLATSLRGWVITGHDIQAEYLSFSFTDLTQHWQMSAFRNAYNACLSVTILPTVLSQTTGLSGVVVFKVLLQLVFALVPVLTFLLSRRFLPRRLALVATTFTIAFPTFSTDMPYLVRQEVAFFFLALLLLAASEPAAERRWTRAGVVLFGLGVVVSHYSTTYVMIMGVVLALVAKGLHDLLGRVVERLHDDGRNPFQMVLLSPVVAVVLIAASIAWAGPITHTGAHASQVVHQTANALTGQGSSGPGSSDTSYSLLGGTKTTPRERLDDAVRASLAYRKQHLSPKDLLVPHPGPAELKPQLMASTKAPLTWVGRAVHALGIDPVTVNSGVKVVAAGVMQVFLLVGLVCLLLRRRLNRGRHGYLAPPELAYLAIGTVGALGLVVIVPNLSVSYGVLRAFQQTMLIVAPLMAAGLWMLLRPLKRLSARGAVGVATVVPVGLLLVLGGSLPTLLGGNEPRISQSNSGIYYDRFYTSDAEQQAIDWLAVTDANARYSSKVIANRNVMVKMLQDTGDAAPIADRLYPTLLTKDAYIFIDPQIVEHGRSTVFYTGDLLTYRYPLGMLNQRRNLVYSSPGTRIYR